MKTIQVTVPPRNVCDAFDKLVKGLHIRIGKNLEDLNTLAAIRDALLPKLLSGEIRVTEDDLLDIAAASDEVFAKTWDNDEDAVYNTMRDLNPKP